MVLIILALTLNWPVSPNVCILILKVLPGLIVEGTITAYVLKEIIMSLPFFFFREGGKEPKKGQKFF